MVKTTLYLPEALKRRLERVAEHEGRSEADVVRAALEEYTASRARPRPRLPLFEGLGVDPTLAERDEELLAEGFGRD